MNEKEEYFDFNYHDLIPVKVGSSSSQLDIEDMYEDTKLIPGIMDFINSIYGCKVVKVPLVNFILKSFYNYVKEYDVLFQFNGLIKRRKHPYILKILGEAEKFTEKKIRKGYFRNFSSKVRRTKRLESK